MGNQEMVWKNYYYFRWLVLQLNIMTDMQSLETNIVNQTDGRYV